MMVGREVCVGVGIATGPEDPEGLIVVVGALRHASVPVFRPFGSAGNQGGIIASVLWGQWGVRWRRLI